jgi:hypothetical protein
MSRPSKSEFFHGLTAGLAGRCFGRTGFDKLLNIHVRVLHLYEDETF